MIKVIDNRPIPAEYPKKINCHTCGSLLEFDKVDEVTKQVPSLTDSTKYNAKGFICPVCNNVVITG